MATYMESGEGTGLVYQAPALGQEDCDAARAAGFISSKRLPARLVTEKGEVSEEIRE